MGLKTIQIRITKTNSRSWYKGCVGDIFDVLPEIKFKGTKTAMYTFPDHKRLVYLRNCEVVPYKEAYPTLSSGYSL